MKTKNKEFLGLVVADNNICIHKGMAYLVHPNDFRDALNDGKDADGNTIEDYVSAKVADLKKVATIFVEMEGLLKGLNKAKAALEDMSLFNETVNVDDNDLSIGCTLIDMDAAKAFLKKV